MTARPISDGLRRALADAPVSRYALAQETGIAQASLSRFLHGERGLSLDNLDALAEALGLHLVPKRRSRRPTKRTER